ncbi:hypothetical protein [Pelomonas sp. SE-A7]|uniref:hypothetical protein n=1 Tax=Pelomonas sp. SE-A7 TaxID=3054953 RepID=UPI00259C8EFD|nr:hypothetical protein [Pelomonas sp. SE-A7]MDM4767019.1 hypothetical protein [Pelomonas sp. SE-A7]
MTSKSAITPRQYLLAGALAATVAATMWAAQLESDENVAPAVAGTRRAAAKAPAPGPAASDTVSGSGGRQPWAPVESLAAWAPPPPPPPPPVQAAAPAAPVMPQAPAFPYQLIGRMEEQGGKSQALLSSPNRTLSARVGETIDGQWRVERIDAQGLALIWLPAQQPQTISFRPIP